MRNSATIRVMALSLSTALAGCQNARLESVKPPMKWSGNYWTAEQNGAGDIIEITEGCGARTEEISISHHQKPPLGFGLFLVRPNPGTTPQQLRCIIDRLGAKPHLMLDVEKLR